MISKLYHRAPLVIAMLVAGVVATAQAAAPAPFGILLNATGTAHGSSKWTLMIGDSLTNGVGAQAFAEFLTSSNGRSTFVAASSGSSMPNWIGAGWLNDPAWGGPNLASLSEYEVFLKPAITIVALGSNDARILTASPSQYSADDNFWKVLDIVNRTRAQSRCVLLTTVADHWSAASSASVNAVNGNMHWADLNMSGVYIADWRNYSAGHADWFNGPTDIHHSNVGKLQYAAYIGNVMKLLIASGQC